MPMALEGRARPYTRYLQAQDYLVLPVRCCAATHIAQHRGLMLHALCRLYATTISIHNLWATALLRCHEQTLRTPLIYDTEV